MDKYGRVYFDHDELIPDCDRKRYEQAIREERHKEIQRRIDRIMKEEDKKLMERLRDR